MAEAKPNNDKLSRRAVLSFTGGLVAVIIIAIGTALIVHESRLTGVEKDVGYVQKSVDELKDTVKDGFKELQAEIRKLREIP